MASRISLLLVALVTLGCSAYVALPVDSHWEPKPQIDIAVFHDALAPYGDWLWVEPWGWAWTPYEIYPGWRPYTHGRWVYTQLGWTWVSYWEWGWAPFHYGRWTYHPPYGWIWIPGTVWAPAWVAWRSGHGWVGWAPLPPQAHWRVGFGLELRDGDLDALIVINAWSFVGERDFLHPRVRDRLAPLPRNAWLSRETRDATRYGEEGRHVVVRGPEREQIERSAGAVEVHRLQDVSRPPDWSEAADRTAVRVYRPEVTEASPMPKPTARPQEAERPEVSEPRPMPKPTVPPQAVEPRPMPKPTVPPQEAEPKPVPKPTTPPQAVEPPAKTPAKPPPAAGAERRQAQEIRQLETWAQQQQEQLDREQRKERKKPAPGEAPEAVEQRQQAERAALAREVAREKELLEKRQQREAQKKEQEAKPPETKPKKKKPAERPPPPG